MKRHNSRIAAIMTLYTIDINKEPEVSIEESLATVLNLINDDEYPAAVDINFAKKLITKYLEDSENINGLLESSLVKWTIDRLSYLDRALLRIAICEMIAYKTPKEIVIDEFLEITKDYSTVGNNDQVRFNNRVLDTVASKIYE